MAQELSKINENKIVELVLTDCKVGCERVEEDLSYPAGDSAYFDFSSHSGRY